MLKLKVSKLYEDAILPKKRLEDSGYDICAYLGNKAYIKIMSGETVKIGTGLCFGIPDGYDLKVYSRSSTGYNGLISMAIVIDQGYQGETHLCIFNSSNKPIVIYDKNKVGELKHLSILKDIALLYSSDDAIFQFVLEPRVNSELDIVSLNEIKGTVSERGVGGFGSTNRRGDV